MQSPFDERDYFAHCVEGFLFGFYSGIFALHLHQHLSKEEIVMHNVKRNIVFYALCILYMLSATLYVLKSVAYVVKSSASNLDGYLIGFRIDWIAQPILLTFCDVIGQSILVHRCWIVWGCNIRVVIVPSILTFACLVMLLAQVGAQFLVYDSWGEVQTASETLWGVDLILTGLTASMLVNALVTGLIALKIFKVFREVKNTSTSEKSLGITHGRKLRSVIFIIIESGVTLFAIQLVRLVVSTPQEINIIQSSIFIIICPIHEMFNGITPTIILVRVSMGLSFHDKPSLEEIVSSLQFAPDNSNGMEFKESICQNIGPDPMPILDIGDKRRDAESDEIQMVDR